MIHCDAIVCLPLGRYECICLYCSELKVTGKVKFLLLIPSSSSCAFFSSLSCFFSFLILKQSTCLKRNLLEWIYNICIYIYTAYTTSLQHCCKESRSRFKLLDGITAIAAVITCSNICILHLLYSSFVGMFLSYVKAVKNAAAAACLNFLFSRKEHYDHL